MNVRQAVTAVSSQAEPAATRSPAATSQGRRDALAGMTVGALGLLAEADGAARSLGSEAIGTDHLLLGMMQAGGGLARRLEAVGLTPGEVRAHVAGGAGRDGDARRDASTTYLSLPCTKQVRRVAELARQYAIVDGCSDVAVDYLLMAIANDGKSAAYDILQRHDPAAAMRLVDGIVDELGSPDGPSAATLTDAAREALELAWSTALALGYGEIRVRHVLAGLAEPGWTIAARAITMLADPHAASLPAPGVGCSNEQHHRIPFAPDARQALRIAATVASDLGKAYLGSEHMLLGIAEASMDELTAFVGAPVAMPDVRAAVAEAVVGAQAARDAESRRGGWRPDAAAPSADADAGAPAGSLALRDELFARARSVAAAGSGRDGTSMPGCWPAFVAAIALNDDADLAELLGLLQLEPAETHALCEDVDDLPVTLAWEWAAERYGDDVSAVELLIAAVSVGSPRVAAVVYELGLTEAELVTQSANWRDKRDGDHAAPASVTWISGANVLSGTATSVLLLEAVISEGAWWKLTLLTLVWSGHPGLGPVASVGIAGLFGFLVSPLVGVVHLLGIAIDIAQARIERQAAWSRTGVRLTLRELRCVVRRTLRAGGGRTNQYLRQLLLANVRAQIPARWRRAGRHA